MFDSDRYGAIHRIFSLLDGGHGEAFTSTPKDIMDVFFDDDDEQRHLKVMDEPSVGP